MLTNISTPPNWSKMSVGKKTNFLKSLSKSTPAKVTENQQWLKSMRSKFPSKATPVAHRDSLKAVKSPRAEKIRLNREWLDNVAKGKKSMAKKAAKGTGAAKAGIMGAKVGTAAGLGVVAGAAGLGALAIRLAKRKFDKTVDEGVKTTDSNYKDLMKAIKRRRNKKSK